MKSMNDVAMGMHYLGERGLIHRVCHTTSITANQDSSLFQDLAASNVLVDKDRRCKVSDFGLLREVPKDDRVYVSQGDGSSPLRWMAPESITDNIFSTASDVWSFGVLQWEMYFPDQTPYPDMTTRQMVVKVTGGYRLATPRGSPPLIARIMRACWLQNPKDRPTFLRISNLLVRRDRLDIF